MTTAIPGPKSHQLLAEMDKMTDASHVHFFVDFDKSVGNYVADADGNMLLDLFAHIASLPIGYNHPALIKAFADPANHSLMMHRPALGNLPPIGFPEQLHKTLESVAPKGLDHFTLMMCGSCSNENAFKAAFIHHMTQRRGGPPTAEDMASCMHNAAPGTPSLSVLSFEGGFHGRLLGCLSATRSKSIHKVDIPAFDWPTAPFPRLRYPLADHARENEAEEARCLARVEEAIEARRASSPVACLIVEPVQAEGGDNHASPAFFRALQQLCSRHGVAFIVDEVQTGVGATGAFWAHEHWGLPEPPDMVTFSKKMQIAGFYHKPEYRPQESYRIFNTWLGHTVDLVKLQAIAAAVREDRLVENTAVTGEFLLGGLEELQTRFPALLSNVRGQGTFCAVDLPSGAARDALLLDLRQRGIEIGGCGDRTMRCRPALVFQPKHAAIFLETLEAALVAM